MSEFDDEYMAQLERQLSTVWLMCPRCQQWIPENRVTVLNIEEDIQGRDVVTWQHPTCGECKEWRQWKSYRCVR